MSSTVLSEFEWDEGLTMPIANAENKSLEEEVQQKQKYSVQLTNELNSNNDRIHAMSEHLKNIRQELHHTQGLQNARKNEIETEIHLKKIAEREEGRLNQEIQRLKLDMKDLEEKRNIYENNVFKQSQRLEELKSQMNWDQQTLEAWLEESLRKEEDAQIVQKYTRYDESKIKELSLKIEKMTEEEQKKKKGLNQETTETLTAQIELDKTAEEFRKAHAERQNLINQWENTIDQMQKRDLEMDLLAAQLSKAKNEVRDHEEMIKEKQQFLENEIENNNEQEKRISIAERAAAKLRLDYQDAEAQRDQFQSELEALKRTVDRTAIDLENTRSHVTQLKKDIIEKTDKLENIKGIHESLVEKLKMEVESTLSAEERAVRMDELLNEEEKRQQEISAELKQLRDAQFKKTQQLHNALTQERNTEAEIQGSRAANRNLGSKINKLDHDSLKQQEIIYNQDFAIQQIERRINRMQGEQSNEEKLHLEAKVSQLGEELEKKVDTHNLLSLQLKRLQDDVRKVKRDLEKSTQEKAAMTSKIEELHLHNNSSNRELKSVIKNKQDMMVEENLLRLEIKRLRDILNGKSDEVLNLQKRRLQLETAMKERKQEISIHQDMLRAQLKAANEERQEVSSELHERISKIDKLRKRYEILMVSMAPPDEEEDKSQAYYVIKAAQEKEELQREGDELDAKIRKAEKEMRALENTLRLMNGRNETYRKSFNKVTESSDDMEDKHQLEEQLRAVMDKYKYKRRQLRELQDDLQTMSHTLDNLARDEDAYEEMVEEKQRKIIQLNKDIDEQMIKMDRVEKQNAKYGRELRQAQKLKGMTPEEKDFEIREMREFNKNINKQIGGAVQQNPDITHSVHLYFSQANLPPPPVPTSSLGSGSSRYSSLPSSARSSLSSVRSVQSGTSSQAAKAVNIGLPEIGSPSASTVSSGRSSRR